MVTQVHNSKDASRSLRNGSAHTVDRFRNGSVDLADETSESDDESLSSCATPRPLGDPLFSGSATPRAAPLPERSYRLRGVNEGEGMAKELARFSTYVGKYAPAFRQLPALLKPGPRHFLPAIGEVDALLKIDRPDGEDDGAGLEQPRENTRRTWAGAQVFAFCDRKAAVVLINVKLSDGLSSAGFT